MFLIQCISLVIVEVAFPYVFCLLRYLIPLVVNAYIFSLTTFTEISSAFYEASDKPFPKMNCN